ncbi:MAG: sigma 54-interacting transcriptional regulator [Polyangiaceae bacterium]|nr:sigma 54-interacting transcriptional regulator [Polyangiaceae bacterium]
MNAVTAPEDIRRLRLERDLLARLVELGAADDIEPFLEGALSLIGSLTGARKGYIELYGAGDAGAQVRIATDLSPEELQAARHTLSTGLVREALETGRVVATASAVDDPRFKDNPSVQSQGIRAVLCAPIGEPSTGVVYLTDRPRAGPFSEDDVACVRLFARHVAPVSRHLLVRERSAAESDFTLPWRSTLQVGHLAGRSRALAGVFRLLAVAKDVVLPVLFTGESGTGKSAFARALHDSSPRAPRPFVEINCAAVPETLFESELFGAERGAHSTADRRIEGKIDAARGGTLFLDEIGEMPLAAQAKLLVFLQSRRYYRLGSTTAIDADVRVMAATNTEPEELVQSRRLREDLYYRINVLAVPIPPLRQRRADIEPIAEAIVQRLGDAHGQPIRLTRAARVALAESDWPGNVRQLENVLQRAWAVALSEHAVAIEPGHLFPARPASQLPRDDETYEEATRRFQRAFIEESLRRNGWNVSETARRLAVARSHLNDLIRIFGLVRPRE